MTSRIANTQAAEQTFDLLLASLHARGSNQRHGGLVRSDGDRAVSPYLTTIYSRERGRCHWLVDRVEFTDVIF